MVSRDLNGTRSHTGAKPLSRLIKALPGLYLVKITTGNVMFALVSYIRKAETKMKQVFLSNTFGNHILHQRQLESSRVGPSATGSVCFADRDNDAKRVGAFHAHLANQPPLKHF